jgi:hypothetical protein
MCNKLNYLSTFLLLFILSASVNAQVDPGTEDITHLWDFQDGTINDKVGTAHGDYFGSNVYVEDGDLINVPDSVLGNADSWVELPGDVIDIGGLYTEISIVAWFTPDTLNTQWNSLWFFGNDGNGGGQGSDGFQFQPSRNNDRARLFISCGRDTNPYELEDAVDDTTGLAETGQYREYDDGQLYHTVCELNDEGVQGEIVLYTNGVLIGATPLTSDAATGKDNRIQNISPNFARLFHSTYAGDIPLTGRIHEIAIYKKALSAEEVTFLFEKGFTSVENNSAQLPGAFSLSQNYPNPFNPGTRISFDLPKELRVKIKVYDMLGKEIALLLDEVKPAGKHSVVFNGSYLSSGVYLYRMEVGNQVFSRKMVLLK